MIGLGAALHLGADVEGTNDDALRLHRLVAGVATQEDRLEIVAFMVRVQQLSHPGPLEELTAAAWEAVGILDGHGLEIAVEHGA